MLISQTAEYALRAVVHLAKNPGEPLPVAEIAREIQVPGPYLSKVLQSLARGGLLRSRRGLGGGFALSREPAALTVLDVVDAVEPIERIESCPLGLEHHGRGLCRLHHRLDAAARAVRQILADTSIADLLEPPDPGLCATTTV